MTLVHLCEETREALIYRVASHGHLCNSTAFLFTCVFTADCIVNDLVCYTTLQLVKLAKRLRKEKVNVDVVSFGEEVSILPVLLRFM